jgi:hypothetical protein
MEKEITDLMSSYGVLVGLEIPKFDLKIQEMINNG